MKQALGLVHSQQAQSRAPQKTPPSAEKCLTLVRRGRLGLLMALVLLGGGAGYHVFAETPARASTATFGTPSSLAPKRWSFFDFGLTPTQSGGRVKPLDSFARETVLFVTGSRSFKGWQSLDLLLSWIAEPELWEQEPFVLVNRQDVRLALGLPEQRSLFTPAELMGHPRLLQEIEALQSQGGDLAPPPPGAVTKKDPKEAEFKAVYERLLVYQGVVSGQGWLLVPRPTPAAWLSLAEATALDPVRAHGQQQEALQPDHHANEQDRGEANEDGSHDTAPKDTLRQESLRTPLPPAARGQDPEAVEAAHRGLHLPSGDDPSAAIIALQFQGVLRAYLSGLEGSFQSQVGLLREAVEGAMEGGSSVKGQSGQVQDTLRYRLLAESNYNRWHLFQWAWIFYFTAGLLFTLALTLALPARLLLGIAQGTMGAAFISHGLGMALRCFIAGRPPVTNMYESVIWVSFGTVVFAFALSWLQKSPAVLAVACFLATLGLIAGDAAPAILDPSIQPLMPVLRSNYWLLIHVLTITSGYAAFALSMGLANLNVYHFCRKAPSSQTNRLNQQIYRATQIGVLLIAAGTILGGVWADASWGRFWGWDPKEVWALITLLCYAVILHGRFTSWIGNFGFAAWSIVAFLSVIMAWYGVNFILGAGLHSYGFATGGSTALAFFLLLQLSYVAGASLLYWRQQKTANS